MLGLGSSLVKGGFSLLSYVKDGLKLFMPYKKGDGSLQFVGTGSTSFDGDNDYVDIGTPSQLDVGDVVTMSAWIKSNDTSAYKWIYQYGEHASTKDRSLVIDSNDKAVFYVYGTNATSTTSVTDGKWHHLVGTLDGVSSKIYVDGVLEDTETPTLANYTYSSVLIGKNNAGSYHFEGSIKNVAVWSRALTATEVQNVMYKTYAEVSGRLASGLVSWWALDATNLGSQIENEGQWTSEDAAFDTFTVSVIDGTQLTCLAESGNNRASIRFPTTAGKKYQIDLTLANITGSPVIKAGNTADLANDQINSPNGEAVSNGKSSYTFVGKAGEGSMYIGFEGTAIGFELTGFTLKEVQIEDLEGSNEGSIFGATIDDDLYGSDTPVIPRAIDNAPTVQADAIGSGSALFVASNTDYIEVGNDSSLQFGTGDFSISAWIKRGSVGAIHQIVGYGDDDGIHWYLGYHSDNKLRFRTDDTSTDTNTYSSSTVADTNWHHISVTCDRDGDTKFYIDGSLDNTTDHSPSSLTLTHASDGFLIGTRNTGGSYTQHFEGNICQVGIWQGALTQEKIQSVMEKTFEELDATEKSSLGAEIISNGTFDSNTTGWASTSTNAITLSQEDGIGGVDNVLKALSTGDGGHLESTQAFTGATGTLYRLSFDIYVPSANSEVTGVSIYPRSGGSGSGMVTITEHYTPTSDTWVSKTFYTTQTSSFDDIRFAQSDGSSTDGASGDIIYMDNISFKAVTHDLVSYWALDEADGNGVVDKVDETLGSELLGTDDDDWTLDAGLSISEGTITFDDSGNLDADYNGSETGTFTFTTDMLYKFVFTTSGDDPQMQMRDHNGNELFATASYATGTHTLYYKAVSANNTNRLLIRCQSAGSSFDISNISLKEVNGNAGVLI